MKPTKDREREKCSIKLMHLKYILYAWVLEVVIKLYMAGHFFAYLNLYHFSYF